jgi:hypothetical protein
MRGAACNQRPGLWLNRCDPAEPTPKDQRANGHQHAGKRGHPKDSKCHIRPRRRVVTHARNALRCQPTGDGTESKAKQERRGCKAKTTRGMRSGIAPN